MIEVLTKKVVDSLVFNSNKFFGWTNLNYMLFFYFLITVVLYFIILINIYILLF
jgi:hypothetical protein